jgi:hypothetical protein
LKISNLTSLTVIPNDTSFLVYLLDLVHEFFRAVGTIHVNLKSRLKMLLYSMKKKHSYGGVGKNSGH